MHRMLVVSTAVVLASAQRPPPPGRLPDFSWETTPVFWHAASPTPYNASQIATLAKYPLITIEKYMGPFPLKPRHGEEDNIAAISALVKAVNPRSRVLMYMNSQFAYPWYRLFGVAEQNGWWVRNKTTGELVTHTVINFNCSNPGHCPGVTVPYWDFTQPGLRQAWLETCTSPKIDGCFMDGAESDFPPFAKGDNTSEYDAARAATFTSIAKTGWLVMINDKKYYDPAPPYPAAQGEFIETFHGDAVKWLDILNRTTDGHIVEAHTSILCHNETDPAGIADLAAFLLAAQNGSYFGCSNWEDVPTWPAVYDKPLGAPIGQATQSSDGTWQRSFAHGTTVSLNYGSKKAVIRWGDGSVHYGAF